MKRNMDLIRSLLFEIEKKHDGSGREVKIDLSQFPNKTSEVVTEHLFILDDGGYIEGKNASYMGGRKYMVLRMTAVGYDFLDLIRDEKIWSQTKAAGKAAGGFTLDLLGQLAKGFLKTKIEKYTGIEL